MSDPARSLPTQCKPKRPARSHAWTLASTEGPRTDYLRTFVCPTMPPKPSRCVVPMWNAGIPSSSFWPRNLLLPQRFETAGALDERSTRLPRCHEGRKRSAGRREKEKSGQLWRQVHLADVSQFNLLAGNQRARRRNQCVRWHLRCFQWYNRPRHLGRR